jgi:hypothetical protein
VLVQATEDEAHDGVVDDRLPLGELRSREAFRIGGDGDDAAGLLVTVVAVLVLDLAVVGDVLAGERRLGEIVRIFAGDGGLRDLNGLVGTTGMNPRMDGRADLLDVERVDRRSELDRTACGLDLQLGMLVVLFYGETARPRVAAATVRETTRLGDESPKTISDVLRPCNFRGLRRCRWPRCRRRWCS